MTICSGSKYVYDSKIQQPVSGHAPSFHGSSGRCELKALYLLEKYHGKGLGRRLLNTAIRKARKDGYGKMYLDTLSSSRNAVRLYEKAGFERTEKYNDNDTADLFMVLKFDTIGVLMF